MLSHERGKTSTLGSTALDTTLSIGTTRTWLTWIFFLAFGDCKEEGKVMILIKKNVMESGENRFGE